MAAPFPPEGVPGSSLDPAEPEALHLYRNYMWLARCAEQLTIAAQHDRKIAMQLVDHARWYREAYEKLQARINDTHTPAQLAATIERLFAFKEVKWAARAAMTADLAAIYDAAGIAADWIDANANSYNDEGFSINKRIAPGVYTDEPIKEAKEPAVTARIANFRALFGPSPAAKG